MLYDDQIKSLLIITLCTFRKEYDKGFRVIDPLNEQNIVIIEESHDWPKYHLQCKYPSPHLFTFLKLVE